MWYLNYRSPPAILRGWAVWGPSHTVGLGKKKPLGLWWHCRVTTYTTLEPSSGTLGSSKFSSPFKPAELRDLYYLQPKSPEYNGKPLSSSLSLCLNAFTSCLCWLPPSPHPHFWAHSGLASAPSFPLTALPRELEGVHRTKPKFQRASQQQALLATLSLASRILHWLSS